MIPARRMDRDVVFASRAEFDAARDAEMNESRAITGGDRVFTSRAAFVAARDADLARAAGLGITPSETLLSRIKQLFENFKIWISNLFTALFTPSMTELSEHTVRADADLDNWIRMHPLTPLGLLA